MRGSAALAATLSLAPLCGAADFVRDIQPIFKRNCVGCHGASMQQSGLRLDQGVAALKGGYSGAVIVPGKSGESKLIRLVSGLDEKVKMPPAGKPLAPETIAKLKEWIDAGAVWPKSADAPAAAAAKPVVTHWSFQPVRRPIAPAVTNLRAVKNPIDRFILARLAKEGFTPSPEADKRTLLRRVSLDLTGLPPAPEQMAAFLADAKPGAYERAVDRLLDSPHYGERWARHWLDLARYADSDGYEKDLARPHAWRYRHWLIDALNHDLPFDQFTIQQIAGDLLPGGGVEQKVATGFHRGTLKNREGGTDPEQFRIEEVLDRTNTVSSVWMGLTVGCAQCHDHKYDPISQRDYYSLFAFFNTAEERMIDAPLPGEQGPWLAALPAYEKQRAELFAKYKVAEVQAEFENNLRFAHANPGKKADWDFQLGVLRVMIDNGPKLLHVPAEKRTHEQATLLTNFMVEWSRSFFPKERFAELKWQELQDAVKKLDASLPPYSRAMVMGENPEPPKTHIHVRGDWREKGIPVEPATPSALPPLPGGSEPPRLRLARWLVAKQNPLTARVAVNRFWNEFFGRGLVRTTEDFGRQGEAPTHPELLDWLAAEFMESGWSMKKMHRLIVTSATYRQESKGRPEIDEKNPDNSLLARQNRLRLPAEWVRDGALQAAGLLDPRIGGRSVKPPQPAGVSDLSYANSVKWVESTGADRYRRGLYVHFQRTSPYPMLMNFDAPESTVTCTRRRRSNTPLQALNLLNDPVFFEASQGLAHRALTQAPGGFRDRLTRAYEWTVCRPPSENETGRLARYFDAEAGALRGDAKTAAALFPHRVDGATAAEAAAWTSLSRVLLNLDEFITRE